MRLHPSNAGLWLMFVSLVTACASAARLPDQEQLKLPQQQLRQNDLLTYYFDVSKPQVSLSAHGSTRPGRTGLTMTLSQPSVSTFMPVISPKASGMTHEVSKTWEALQHLSTMFERVKAPNSKQPNQPRLFPRGSLAIQAAADISPNKVDINAIITAAEARGQHDIWAETSPGSLLLLPTGQSTAAIADLMDVTYNSETGLMSLHVELVDNPDTISEFQPHGKQSLASDEAHYHFSTAPGVKVDAAALLKSLQEANFDINGMHLFIKGTNRGATSCATVTIEAQESIVAPGSTIQISANVTNSACTGESFEAGAVLLLYLVGDAKWGGRRAADVEAPEANTPHTGRADGSQITYSIALSDGDGDGVWTGTATATAGGGLPFLVQAGFLGLPSKNGLDGFLPEPIILYFNTEPPASCATISKITTDPVFTPGLNTFTVGADALVTVTFDVNVSACTTDFTGTTPFLELEAVNGIWNSASGRRIGADVARRVGGRARLHTGMAQAGASTRSEIVSYIRAYIDVNGQAWATLNGKGPFTIQALLIDADQQTPPAYWGRIYGSGSGSSIAGFNVVDPVFIPSIKDTCANVSITSNSPSGNEVDITVTVDISTTGSSCSAAAQWGTGPYVFLQLVGAELVTRRIQKQPNNGHPQLLTGRLSNRDKRDARSGGGESLALILVVSGRQATANFTVRILEDGGARGIGPALVSAIGVSNIRYPGISGGVPGYFPGGSALFLTNCAEPVDPGTRPAVAKVVLLPAKAYRHVHDPITVSATALDANNAPIANASVVLAVYGDCDPWVSRLNYTTNAAGQAFFTIMSTQPGAVSVVAAMVDSNGLPVLSLASHVIFFEEHSYIDEREEQYFGRHGHAHGDKPYGGDEEEQYGSDAEGYAAAAKKAVLQSINALAAPQR